MLSALTVYDEAPVTGLQESVTGVPLEEQEYARPVGAVRATGAETVTVTCAIDE